jgi:hypothetical protein
MAIKSSLLDPIIHIAKDYQGVGVSATQIERWIGQFEVPVQEPILKEIGHVLAHTYFSKTDVESFLKGLVKNSKLTGSDPASFWQTAKCLDIQQGGRSQHEMLSMFDATLQSQLGFGLVSCGKNKPSTFVYIDDGLYSGHRIIRDLGDWIKGAAPSQAAVHVIVIALHAYGNYYANKSLKDVASAAGKSIGITWWRLRDVEDRKAYTNESDVLRPTELPADTMVQQYAAALKYPPHFRQPGNVGPLKIFSSEAGRYLLEQEFLKAGVRVRAMCPLLGKYQRPLGSVVLDTLGFGSMIVTFRNCPNNAPLALWAGSPWRPLFPRKNN